MLLAELAAGASRVAETGSRLNKIAILADLLQRLEPAEVEIAIGFLLGWPRQGRLGIGWASLRDSRDVPIATEPSLSLAQVDETFARIVQVSGKGANKARLEGLRQLLALTTEPERRFLSSLVMGDMRQGALEGVLAESVAKAVGVEGAQVRRAAMLAGDLGLVARTVLLDGVVALDRFSIQPFRPVQPMLADSVDTLAEALAQLGGEAALEWKLDGARIQVHKDGDQVRVYTRSLNDVTAAVPDVVARVRSLPAERLVLDGEALALTAEGRPEPFQVTMQRFGGAGGLTPYFFDVLLIDGDELIDHSQGERFARLVEALPSDLVVPHLITTSVQQAEAFQAVALERGHEGVMAKALGSPYEAGRRGSSWLKLKRARTLDLVVLAVEWGSGRRTGWLSNIHLGARDAAGGGFIMLGKTFKGMTDEMLAWQTKEFLAREVSRDQHTVWLRPEIVVEVAFNEVQASSHYPGGVALRFARVKRYRPDRTPANADTIDAVREFYRKATGRDAPPVTADRRIRGPN